MSGPPWRVYLVDDDDVVVRMLWRVLEADGRFVVLGCASTVGQASAGIEAGQPEVLVLDNTLPDALGAPAARALRAVAPGARVVVLSTTDAVAGHEAMGVDRWVHKRDLLTMPDVIAGVMASPET